METRGPLKGPRGLLKGPGGPPATGTGPGLIFVWFSTAKTAQNLATLRRGEGPGPLSCKKPHKMFKSAGAGRAQVSCGQVERVSMHEAC